MVSPVIGEGRCAMCGAPIKLRKAFVTKWCSRKCADKRRNENKKLRQTMLANENVVAFPKKENKT